MTAGKVHRWAHYRFAWAGRGTGLSDEKELELKWRAKLEVVFVNTRIQNFTPNSLSNIRLLELRESAECKSEPWTFTVVIRGFSSSRIHFTVTVAIVLITTGAVQPYMLYIWKCQSWWPRIKIFLRFFFFIDDDAFYNRLSHTVWLL